ncbi:hypothetical protein GXW82_32920 [Streptacidiphilus sp. 4-A2]|nr:hypothetical protein [Streptacidiphilus sp. 4-A2]
MTASQQHAAAGADAAFADAGRTAAAARAELTRAEGHLAALEELGAEARIRWGDHVPDDAWSTDEERRERAAPWSDPELCQARSELFLAALDLHHAFARCTARTLRQNLIAAMDVVTGAVPPTVPSAARQAAWQSLFLVVPVVSTTFASLDRVFAGLGPQTLGWLFIDEAGQAAPQMAVGALWRSQRAVVVGDPLQLEPVVILPFTAQQALRRDFDVSEDWLPSRTSTQQLADRHNRYGTELEAELPEGPGSVWVGAPLRVHRRCENRCSPSATPSPTTGSWSTAPPTTTTARIHRPAPGSMSPRPWPRATGFPQKAAPCSRSCGRSPLHPASRSTATSSSSPPSATWSTARRRSPRGSSTPPASVLFTPLRARRPTSSSWSWAPTRRNPEPEVGPPSGPTC